MVLNRTINFINKYHYVIFLLVRKQMLLRYRRTKLGFVWTILNPLLMMTVLAFVFSAIMSIPLKDYALFFFSGMIVWNYINYSINIASNCLIENEALINKIYLPKEIFPLSISIALLIDAILSFFPFFIIMIFLGAEVNLSSISILFAYFLIFIFVTGLSFLVSVATVFFRDLAYIIPIFLQALFFLTPILYPVSRLEGNLVASLFNYNPISPYINLVREPITNGQFCTIEEYLIAISLSATSFVIGLYFLNKNKTKIIHYL